MPTNMTFTASRTTVQSPVGADPAALSGLVSMAQGIGNMVAWNKESLIVAGNTTVAATGDYPYTTSFATLTRTAVAAEHALTLAIDDIVFLFASGSVAFSAASDDYRLRLYNGSADLAGIRFEKATAWSSGECVPWSMQAVYVATGAGAMTFSLQGRSGAAAITAIEGSTGKLVFGYVHVKKGTA